MLLEGPGTGLANPSIHLDAVLAKSLFRVKVHEIHRLDQQSKI